MQALPLQASHLPPLDVARLTPVMERTQGERRVRVGLIDGPIVVDHPDLVSEHVHFLSSKGSGLSEPASGAARAHGTYVAGILSGRRGSVAPAICPGCTLLVRPIFLESTAGSVEMPSASPSVLADAIVDCVDAGAKILNLSVALSTPSANSQPKLEQALTYAGARGAVVVAAAGNQGAVAASAILRHPWVVPVASCDLAGRPMATSNLGSSIARRGLMAPGDAITSLALDGRYTVSGGTSAAVPFVSGTFALLFSLFPDASNALVMSAVVRTHIRRSTIVPPLLDAWSACQEINGRRS